MLTSAESLRPTPKEPRSTSGLKSFFVRRFMLLSYGSSTFRIFSTSFFSSLSSCIVAATNFSPETSRNNVTTFFSISAQKCQLTKMNLKCLSYHFLERLCCLWFLQQQLLPQRDPARGFLRSLHSCCPGPLTVVRIHSMRFLHQALFTFLCMIVSHCMCNIVILTIISITCTSQNSYDNSGECGNCSNIICETKESRGSFYLKLTRCREAKLNVVFVGKLYSFWSLITNNAATCSFQLINKNTDLGAAKKNGVSLFLPVQQTFCNTIHMDTHKWNAFCFFK